MAVHCGHSHLGRRALGIWRHTCQVHSHACQVHEALLASPHRTLNPAGADFFFVPVYGGCYISRFFRPTVIHNLLFRPEWLPAPVLGNRFYREAYHWVRHSHPYWNASGGRDHIFAFPHDEGACIAPIELKNSIFLTSWGRLQVRDHGSLLISARLTSDLGEVD